MDYIIFLTLLALGFGAVIYAMPLARLFGRMPWAERYLGQGNTYLAWRMAGIAAIVLAFLVLRYPALAGR